jgi:hypothetical protein
MALIMKRLICPYDKRVFCGFLEASETNGITYSCCDCPRYKPELAEPENSPEPKIFHAFIAIMALFIIGIACCAFYWLISFFRP